MRIWSCAICMLICAILSNKYYCYYYYYYYYYYYIVRRAVHNWSSVCKQSPFVEVQLYTSTSFFTCNHFIFLVFKIASSLNICQVSTPVKSGWWAAICLVSYPAVFFNLLFAWSLFPLLWWSKDCVINRGSICKKIHLIPQPRPQGLLLVQNGGRRNPWPRLLKYSKNRGVFCHVTHEEMAFSEVVSSVWRPCLFSAIGNRCPNETKTFHRVYLTKF